ERGFGRGDGGFGVGDGAVDHLAQGFAGAGIDGVDGAVRLRLLPLAGVIGIAMRGQIGSERLDLGRGCNCNHGTPLQDDDQKRLMSSRPPTRPMSVLAPIAITNRMISSAYICGM